ncbi:MAG: hypothetical protein RLZZ505_1309 [Verrucomicrobiota bacterium]|jgi:hypothetical protein
MAGMPANMSKRNKPSKTGQSALFSILLILNTLVVNASPIPQSEMRIVEAPAFGEMSFIPNGVNLTPNWGINRVGARWNDGPVYTYADTTNPVRLYLIDTAVANPGNWMGQNPNIDFEGTIMVRSLLDPLTSTQFGHGTRMLSLICDLKAGVSPGTPIKVRNYDVYTSGLTTNATKLAYAIEDAVAHYQDSNPQIPSVICIASSSSLAGTSAGLKSSISYAVSEGLTVIVSAGNSGLDASGYIPAAYGTMQGVICVGATDSANNRTAISNFGAPVTIHAPGQNILVKHESTTGYVSMQGTSPAAALVVGTALTELSMDGSLTPAALEAKLISNAAPTSIVGSPPVLRTTPVPVVP